MFLIITRNRCFFSIGFDPSPCSRAPTHRPAWRASLSWSWELHQRLVPAKSHLQMGDVRCPIILLKETQNFTVTHNVFVLQVWFWFNTCLESVQTLLLISPPEVGQNVLSGAQMSVSINAHGTDKIMNKINKNSCWGAFLARQIYLRSSSPVVAWNHQGGNKTRPADTRTRLTWLRIGSASSVLLLASCSGFKLRKVATPQKKNHPESISATMFRAWLWGRYILPSGHQCHAI